VLCCAPSWLLEEASTSTRTNALFSLDIIARQQGQQGQGQQQQQQQQDTQQRQEQLAHSPHDDLLQEEEQAVQQDNPRHGRQGQQLGWRRVVVVTNPFHQLRSYRVFRRAAADAGMDVQVRVARG
jgi:uncharacterized SAM-binding protein YcdF (DUF218 family)